MDHGADFVGPSQRILPLACDDSEGTYQVGTVHAHAHGACKMDFLTFCGVFSLGILFATWVMDELGQ
jgi:hypothetical protein